MLKSTMSAAVVTRVRSRGKSQPKQHDNLHVNISNVKIGSTRLIQSSNERLQEAQIVADGAGLLKVKNHTQLLVGRSATPTTAATGAILGVSNGIVKTAAVNHVA